MFHSIYHKCKSLFLHSCPPGFIRFLCESIANLIEGNLQSLKGHFKTNFQNKVQLHFLKRIISKQGRDVLACEKGLELMKVMTHPVIKHMFWHGAVCSRSCFCVQQKLECAVSYKAKTSKVSTITNYHAPIWFAYEWSKQKTVCQSRLFISSCPRIKLSNSQTLVLDGV